MTYNLKNLSVASLDFDDIVQNLSSFLQKQPDLADVNFTDEGTAAKMLIDILATSTAYAGVYAQFGYVNSWPVTANMVESVLGCASLSSVLIPYTQSASCYATISTTEPSGIARYTTFNGQASNGAALYFFNIDPISATGVGSYIPLYCGTSTVTYTNYDYKTQSCIIPKTVDPRTITMRITPASGLQTDTYFTRVEKGNNTSTGNQNIFTVVHSYDGNYLVTNNLPNAANISTSYKVSVQAVVSNGSVGNNASISLPTYMSSVFQTAPFGGYDALTLNTAKAKYTFNANGHQRCVTLNDFKNAIAASGISGTDDTSLISVRTGDGPGIVNVYVTGLSTANQTLLLSYLSTKSIAGINVVYGL